MDFLGFSLWTTKSSVNREFCLVFSLSQYSGALEQCWIGLARASLSYSNLKIEACSITLLNILTTGFWLGIFYQTEEVLFSICWKNFKSLIGVEFCQMLLWIYWGDHVVCLICSINMVNYIDLFWNVKLAILV